MIPYVVVMNVVSGTKVTLLWGKDRNEMMDFCKKHYRSILSQIVSCKQAKEYIDGQSVRA